MFVRWIAPSPLVLALIAFPAVPARAQSPSVLSGRADADAAFARKLFEHGQTDMADKLCTLLEQGGKLSGSAEKVVKSLHIDLRADLAKKTSDLPKRKDLLKQVLQDKEEFIKQHQGTPEAEEAALTLPDVYGQLGDTLKSLIEKETQPQVIADYQNRGPEGLRRGRGAPQDAHRGAAEAGRRGEPQGHARRGQAQAAQHAAHDRALQSAADHGRARAHVSEGRVPSEEPARRRGQEAAGVRTRLR
jgi:hypothetical protein